MNKLLSNIFLSSFFLLYIFSFLSSPLCQNLYFQPGALEKMEEYGCNLEQVENDIFRVRTGIY